MDVFVLSSDTEQMPLTVLEAMASGLPIVSTDVGDVRAMVHESNREFMSPKADASSLAGQLQRLIVDAELRQTIGVRNRQHCEATYAKDACYQAWIELYRQVIGW
jgi:glycosyltransferase involved in cell wall biosynthesis